MATITEDYVSFEVAKLLKEKEFHENVNHVYHYYTSVPFYRRHLRDFNGEDYKNLKHEHYSAPTLQIAMKWLREIHNIFINIIYENDCVFTANIKVPSIGVDCKVDNKHNCWFTYEEAAEVAIKYCLENLI